MASDAEASTTSLSVIAPTPPLITLTFTPSTLIFSSAFLTASKEPFTSAFSTTFISFTPSHIVFSFYATQHIKEQSAIIELLPI